MKLNTKNLVMLIALLTLTMNFNSYANTTVNEGLDEGVEYAQVNDSTTSEEDAEVMIDSDESETASVIDEEESSEDSTSDI